MPEERPDAARWPVWALIREARRSAGLTQSELAEAAGTTQSAVSEYERALVLPDLWTLTRLLEACDMELTIGMRPRSVETSTAAERSVDERLVSNDDYTELVSQLRG